MIVQRSTKIVATLGPASSEEAVLRRMVLAGVDIVRLNFSHGTAEDHAARVRLLRAITKDTGRTVGIMADLQGPKIRVGKFEHGKVELVAGAPFILDVACKLGNAERVGLDYPELIDDVEPGVVLLLDDGRIVLDIVAVHSQEIVTTVRVGGVLSNNKGINRQGGGLTAPALTSKDRQDIRTAAELGVDFVAVSFPKHGDDMRQARKLLTRAGSSALLVAKIERAEAINALPDICDASDALMVARGDLAVEVGDAAVPALQKKIIRTAREHNRLAITATQMMESMITSPVPTRAEVSDVANAVLDGTDAVMLSAETASGKYPVETIESMARICLEAEKSAEVTLDNDFLDRIFTRIDQSIAMAAIWTAHHLKVGHRRPHPVRLYRPLDEPAQLRRPHLRPHPGSQLALQDEPLPGRLSPAHEAETRRPRPPALGGRATAHRAGRGRGGRPHRADHRRAHRLLRRHQHHENRPRRRTSKTLNP